MKNKVNILGTEYKIYHKTDKEDKKLEVCDGYCDFSIKIISYLKRVEKGILGLEDFDRMERKILRHEIIHAFIYESGLWENSAQIEHWSTNEEMTDWIAIQFPKIYKVFKELDILE